MSELYPDIEDEISDPTFANRLKKLISRDYSIYISKGFQIFVEGDGIDDYGYAVRQSGAFAPFRHQYTDESGVEVEIIAGMAAAPPDDVGPSDETIETAYFGWFVLCNDRVVLAANKSDKTVWGDEDFNIWHYQYNGFMGMALFHSGKAGLLPWTTTKRDIDESSPIYRRAVTQMKKATLSWIEYTNKRKADLEAAKAKESQGTIVSPFLIRQDSDFKVPETPRAPRVKVANISYSRPLAEVRKVAKALGYQHMNYRDVGIKTFEYYLENEVD